MIVLVSIGAVWLPFSGVVDAMIRARDFSERHAPLPNQEWRVGAEASMHLKADPKFLQYVQWSGPAEMEDKFLGIPIRWGVSDDRRLIQLVSA